MRGRINRGDYRDQRYKPSTTVATFEFANDDAVVFHGFDGKGRPWAQAYHGKAGKPDWYIQFSTVDNMNAKIRAWLKCLREHKARKQAARDAQKNFRHNLRIGMLLKGSWGYDQTNIEYWMVVELRGKSSVIVAPVGLETVEETGWAMRKVRPNPESVNMNKAVRKIVQPGDYLSFDCFSLSPCGIDTEMLETSYH